MFHGSKTGFRAQVSLGPSHSKPALPLQDSEPLTLSGTNKAPESNLETEGSRDRICRSILATPASFPTPPDHYDFAETEAQVTLAGPSPEEPSAEPPCQSRPGWTLETAEASGTASGHSVPLPHGAQRLWPAGGGRVCGPLLSCTWSRYEAAHGGARAQQPQAARGGPGRLEHLRPHHLLHSLLLQPSSVPPGQAPLGTGPTYLLVILYWERCLLCPQLKVEDHPASTVVQSPGGK